MNKALEALQERGFIKQCTDIDALSKKMDEGPVTFYVGIDPTGPSMHIGHTVPLYALFHLCSFGHKGIVIVGGGTARIGDPSGKDEMRAIQTEAKIDENVEALGAQIKEFTKSVSDNVTVVNNHDWLGGLKYIDFLREIGRHFSVNRMLSFETYKKRMENGLSFIEFNYQLLQSFDFLTLNQKYDCHLQIGGDDQWGNIVAGVDLTRRVESKEVFGLTFPLVTRADGKKMGKSEKGAIFLNKDMCSTYDFFQYWRNVPDQNVEEFLMRFTFMPVEKAKELGALKDQAINQAKETLAYEVTKLVHGQEEADKALAAAKAAFAGGGSKEGMPTGELERSAIEAGINSLELFASTELCSSKGEARRLITQGGAKINEKKVDGIETTIDTSWLNEDGELILRAGKKRFFLIKIVD